MKAIVLVMLFLASIACSSCHATVGPFEPDPAPQPEPPSPWEAGDAAPAPVPSGSCQAACARGAKLNCSWAKPTPKGASCVDVCLNGEGSPSSMQPDCVKNADSCDSAAACAAIP